MKHLFFLAVLLFVFPIFVFADLAHYSIGEHVAQSDLAVVGTLVSSSETNWYMERSGHGFIEIDSVLTKGVNTTDGVLLAPEDKLQINWIENIPCVYGWHSRTEKKKGIWLLQIESDGTVSAYHPGKFIDLQELSNVNKFLKKSKRNNVRNVNKARLRTYQDVGSRSLSSALLVFTFALIAFGVLYRSRIKIRIKRNRESEG